MAGRLKLGELLLKAGVINQEQLRSALEDQKRYGGRLATILLERRIITEKVYFKALSTQLKIPAVDFSKSSIPEAICRLVPREMAEKHAVFPVATRRAAGGNVLLLAMADPTNVAVQDEIRFRIGYKVEPLLGLENTIRSVIREFWYEQEGKGSYTYKPDIELAAGAAENPAQGDGDLPWGRAPGIGATRSRRGPGRETGRPGPGRARARAGSAPVDPRAADSAQAFGAQGPHHPTGISGCIQGDLNLAIRRNAAADLIAEENKSFTFTFTFRFTVWR